MIKKGILILLPFFVIALAGALLSLLIPSEKATQTSAYSITGYTIDAVVKKDNSILVDETIDVDFKQKSHGIYRYIPYYQTVQFEENGKSFSENYKVEIDFNSLRSDSCECYSDGMNFVMQIGNPNISLIGDQTFHVSYVIKLGDDKISDFDQLYYNFIGTGWDTTISNVELNIEFEKQISNRMIYFYVGTSNGDKTFSQTIENNKVSFSYSGKIQPFHGLTARTVLEQGYFETKKNSLLPNVLILLSSLAFFGVAFVVYIVNKNKNKIVPIVEFEAPENITPSDAGYIIDGVVNNGDVSALVVYWAKKGFVKINETSGKTILTKVKDADESFKSYEKDIFNSMFHGKEDFNISEVDQKTALSISNARKAIKNENSKFFNKKIIALKSVFVLFYMIIIGVGFKVISNITATYISPIVCFAVAIICGSIIVWLMTVEEQKLTLTKKRHFWIKVPLYLTLLTVYITFAVFCVDLYSDPLLTAIFVPIVSFLAFLFIPKLNVRKEGENKEVGRVLGLREFILATEQDRLKVLAKDNPELFYDVLPYAYVLGISDVWIDKFKTIDIQSPDWYVSDVNLLNVYIGARILSSMNSINAVVVRSIAQSTAKTVSKFGKFFGGKGGGFSGGGFGGGGGGRW